MDTLLQIGLGNALVAALLAVLVAGFCKICRRPALVHTLWLLVLVKLVAPSPLVLPMSWPEGLPFGGSSIKHRASSIEDRTVQSSIFDSQSSIEQELLGAAAWLERFWVPLVGMLWLTGTTLWFALAGVRSYRFARLMRFGRPAPGELQAQARRLADGLGLGHCPGVWLMPGMLSPMLWGLGRRARLLLPAELVGRLDPEQLQTLLVHELAHARRRDPWVRVLELLVLGLYWWHPVAWWARRRLREAEEQCCDAWVVWALPAAAPSYATALVETVAFLAAARPALPPVASGVSSVHVLKQRLTLILCGTPPKGIPVCGLLAVLGLGLVLLPWRPVWGQNVPAEPPPTPLTQPSPLGGEGWVREDVLLVGQSEADPPLPSVPVRVAANPKKEDDKETSPQPRPDRGFGGHDRPGDWRDGPPPPRGPGGPPRPGMRDGPGGRGDSPRDRMEGRGRRPIGRG